MKTNDEGHSRNNFFSRIKHISTYQDEAKNRINEIW